MKSLKETIFRKKRDSLLGVEKNEVRFEYIPINSLLSFCMNDDYVFIIIKCRRPIPQALS